MIYKSSVMSPVGSITMASDGKNITGLWLEGQKYFESTLKEDPIKGELPIFKDAIQWLDCYFSGKEPNFQLPLAPAGSPFRQSVWKILSEIPYGQVRTYGQIAKQLELQAEGKFMSAQAVGGAVGHNPISIMIPCHRVVGADGSLTGYAGGINKKIQLLQLENAPLENFYTPKKGTAL